MLHYVAVIDKEGASDYGVSFPDFPGCVSAGRTLDEARRMAEEALTLHVQGMAEDGDALPEPSSLDAALTERRESVCAYLLVPVPEPDAPPVGPSPPLPPS